MSLIERRKNCRIKTKNLKAHCRLSESKSYSEVEVINIAPEGICFLRNFELNKSDSLNFVFSFGNNKFAVHGIVRRISGREVFMQFDDSDDKIDSLWGMTSSNKIYHEEICETNENKISDEDKTMFDL